MLRNKIYDFLVFVSGSDKDVLEICQKSEHTKHAMYGALILVPAILGFVSMSYAISTISSKPYVFLTAGALWGIIVMIIDRFIVSSYRKVPLIEDSDFWHHLFAAWGAVLSRIILAAVIGIAVGHPLVLWYFDDVIQDELRKEKIKKYQDFENSAKGNVNNIRSEYERISRKVDEENRLYLLEMTGGKGEMVSGVAGEGPLAKRAELQAAIYTAQRDSVQKILDTENLKAKSEAEKNKNNLDAQNVGYMSKDQALEELIKEKGWEIEGKRYFIIFCFVLLDTIVVVLKAGLRAGPYDFLLTEKERSDINNNVIGKIVWKQKDKVKIDKDYDNRLEHEIEKEYDIFKEKQNKRADFEKLSIQKEYELKTVHENNLFEINKAYAQEQYNELLKEFKDSDIFNELSRKINKV